MLPLIIFTKQTPDSTKTISPPNLEIDFLIGSAATLNLLNYNTWIEIEGYHKLQLEASTFVLSASSNSKIQSHGTVIFSLYPDLTEYRIHQNINFTLTFYLSNTKFNILGTPFLEKYVETINCSSHTLEIKLNYERKSRKLYEFSTKSLPYYS